MGDCPKIYTNQGTDSFGNGKFVTAQMLLGFCQSLAWLKDQTEQLQESSDPEVRKWVSPVNPANPLCMVINTELSYGMIPSSNGYIFDETQSYVFETFLQQSPEPSVVADGAAPLIIDHTNTTAFVDYVNAMGSLVKGYSTGAVMVPKMIGATGTWATDTNGAYSKVNALPGANLCLRIFDKTNNKTYVRMGSKTAVEAAATVGTSSATTGAWYHDTINNALYIKCYLNASSGTAPAPNTVDLEIEVINAYSRGKQTSTEQISGVNTHWYVGFKRDVPYFASPEQFSTELTDITIPTLCRAETFKSTITGKLNSITLNIKGNALAEDKLYVEIRNVAGTAGNYTPGTTILARASVDPSKFAKTGVLTIPFKHPIPVTANTSYCWVVRSPFTSLCHFLVGVGGWGKNCISIDIQMECLQVITMDIHGCKHEKR